MKWSEALKKTGIGSIVFLVLYSNAYAYLDLGSGSYVIQVLIASLFGMLFVIKKWWKEILKFLSNLFSIKK